MSIFRIYGEAGMTEIVCLQMPQTAIVIPDELLVARRSFWAHVLVWSSGSSRDRLDGLVQTRATLLMHILSNSTLGLSPLPLSRLRSCHDDSSVYAVRYAEAASS